jgi:nitroimidazol reductase NimA-like FMN-containing flavoprotein (pyridoxamine 5'-phosphate oxidase superfamily)
MRRTPVTSHPTTTTTELIETGECRKLLASKTFGRLAVIIDSQPEVFPVNYRYVADAIIFVTDEGSKLRGADLAPVTFEIDDVDPDGRGGWSVVVKGTAHDITTALDNTSVSMRALDVESIRGGARLVRIVPRQITGRRQVPAA